MIIWDTYDQYFSEIQGREGGRIIMVEYAVRISYL